MITTMIPSIRARSEAKETLHKEFVKGIPTFDLTADIPVEKCARLPGELLIRRGRLLMFRLAPALSPLLLKDVGSYLRRSIYDIQMLGKAIFALALERRRNFRAVGLDMR